MRRAALPLLLLLSTACAPQLSPQQEVIWDGYKACQAQGPSTRLDRVTVDGGWYISGRGHEVQRVHDCMLAYRRKAQLEQHAFPVPAKLVVTPAPAGGKGLVIVEPPVWSRGDTWRFSSSSSSGRKFNYTWRVEREDMVDGVACYVIKTGAREVFYRKSDLALSHETRNGELESRNTPARMSFVWPLGAGARWEQTYHYQSPGRKLSYDTTYTATVEGEDTVSVPAGTFRTLKIVHRRISTNAITSEEWYAPDVRMWVRIREPARQDGERTRELLSFTAGGKTGP